MYFATCKAPFGDLMNKINILCRPGAIRRRSYGSNTAGSLMLFWGAFDYRFLRT